MLQLTITAHDDNVTYDLWPSSTEKEIYQNISTLLRTEKYSVPLGRNIGMKMDYIDAPIEAAKAMIRSDLFTLLPRFEPRVKVESIDFFRDERNIAKLIPKVRVSIVE